MLTLIPPVNNLNKFAALIVATALLSPVASAQFWGIGRYGCTVTDAYFVGQSSPDRVGPWGNSPRVVTVEIDPCNIDADCIFFIQAISTDKFYSGGAVDDVSSDRWTLQITGDITTLNSDGTIVGTTVAPIESRVQENAIFYFFGECTKF
jgi:hypothetical protein